MEEKTENRTSGNSPLRKVRGKKESAKQRSPVIGKEKKNQTNAVSCHVVNREEESFKKEEILKAARRCN